MVTHKYELSEGGYFYRFYPKVAVSIRTDKEQHADLFNPAPTAYTSVYHSLFGKFIRKYEEKSKLIIQLHAKGFFGFQDEDTGEQEGRELESHLLLQVSKELYNYPFILNGIYTISPTEVKHLRP